MSALSELLDRVAREDRDAMIRDEVAKRLAAERKRRPEPPPEPEPPTRSEMSPADKSRYIEAHGIERYRALPWE